MFFLDLSKYTKWIYQMYKRPHIALYRIYEHGKKRIPAIVQIYRHLLPQIELLIENISDDLKYIQEEKLNAMNSQPFDHRWSSSLDNMIYLVDSCIQLLNS